MKKIKMMLVALFVCALGYGSYSAYDYATMTDAERFLLANIEALTQYEPGGGDLDTNYVRNPSKCSIYIGINGKLKLFGVGILKADATGYVSFDGQVSCQSGGNSTCRPVECIDLYEIILK